MKQLGQEALDILRRIASMSAFGVPEGDIANACGVTPGRISQLKGTEEYKEVEKGYLAQRYQEAQDLNDGWNTVEALGLETVIRQLKVNKDPDFALRAAMLANKAQRRGSHPDNRDIPARHGTVIHLQLPVQVVNQIHQASAQPAVEAPDVRRVSVLSAPRVHDLFKTEVEKIVDALGPEFEVA